MTSSCASTGSNRDAQKLNEIFAAIGTLPGSSSLIAQMRATASQGEHSAVAGFRALMWRVILANLQRDPMFYIVYLGLQLVLAWDFSRLWSYSKSGNDNSGNIRMPWFVALGQCEALIAAATLADENPGVVLPGSKR